MPAYHVVTPEGKVRKASRQEVRAPRRDLGLEEAEVQPALAAG